MLLAEFPWEITPIAGCGMSGTAAGWISLRYKSHGGRWNFWQCNHVLVLKGPVQSGVFDQKMMNQRPGQFFYFQKVKKTGLNL